MEEREISIKELINVVWNGKILIGVLTGVLAVLGLAAGLYMNSNSSTIATVVNFQWDGVTNGEYPDGTRFDYNDMLESYTIDAAAVTAGVTEVSTDELRNGIKITPLIPGATRIIIEEALYQGEQISYFATNYRITFDNGDLDLSVNEGKAFLNNLLEEFRIDFEKKYIQTNIVLDYTGDNLEEYDYLDAYEVLDAQIRLINSAMEYGLDQDPGFFSTSAQMTFSDVLVRTSLLMSIQLKQIESRTNTYLLSKDSDYLITKYSYDNVVLQLDLDKNHAKEVAAKDLVDNSTGDQTTILIPGVDGSESITFDSYHEMLLSNLIVIQNKIADLEQDIAYNELLIAKLEANATLNPTDQAKYDAEVEKVEDAITFTSDELGEIIQDSNTLLTEYNAYSISNIIKPLMTPQYESNVNVLLYTAIGLILGGGIGVVVVLFKHDWE